MAEKTKTLQKCKNKKVCWTVEEEELLVELWPNYECLYKTNSPEFKRVDKRQSAREDIRRKLETELESSFTDADIKAKIRNLRTQYGKEMGKVRASVASGAGTSSVYEPSWRFYNSLHFLRDSITPVKTKPTSGVPEVRLRGRSDWVPGTSARAPGTVKQDVQTGSQSLV
ncbi:Hypothetical predicted protein [Paramuricea clavata]|uniref:Uncharacterized protein n=1 Tax=Paramuricea clavata TaxID=317549 RepID=A0A6S7LMS5_PARCT|nr:Hypothetical predicted protein [Paramuricea clavata]